LAYRADLQGLIITGIVQGMAVDTWNRVADTDRCICVGDRIVGVGSEEFDKDAKTLEDSNGHAVVAALTAATETATLKIKKFGPRWHIEGDTADCIDKMNYVAEQGMVLELVQPDSLAVLEDDVVKEKDMKSVSRNQFLLIVLAICIPNLLLVLLFSDMGMGIAIFEAFASSMMNTAGNLIIFGASMTLVGMYLVDWHKWESKVQRGASALIVIYIACFGGILKCRFYPSAPMVIILFHLPLFIGVLRATALKQVQRGSFYRAIGISCLIVGFGLLFIWLLWIFVPGWDGDNQYDEATQLRLIEESSKLYEETKLEVNGVKRPLNYQWDCDIESDYDYKLVYGVPVATSYELTDDEKDTRTSSCASVRTVWFLIWMAPLVGVIVSLIVAAFCAINGTMMEMSDTSRAEKALKQFVFMVGIVLLGMWVAASTAGASLRLTGTLMAFGGAGIAVLLIWVYFEVGTKLIHSTIKQSKLMTTMIMVVTNDWFRACVVIGFNFLIPTMFLVEIARQKVRRLRKNTTSETWLTPEATTAWSVLRSWQWASIFQKVNLLVMLYWTVSIGVSKMTVVFLAWLNERLADVNFIAVLFIFFLIGYTMFLLPPVPGIPVYVCSGIIIAAQARSLAIGFVGGIIIAIFLSLVLKIAAVCGQYSIGYFLGKSVKIQQLVGVDKVPIRSVEKILLRRGLDLGKVAVLVGGPDWPTSVLCGILNLNLFQCCLGTLPVILVSSPCVLTGAFMAGPKDNMTESEQSVWDTLANTALAASGVGQLASGVIAMYYIQEVVNKHGEELAAPRPEHEAVRQLTIAEKESNEVYAEVVNWNTLPKFWLGVISTSSIFILTSLFIFMFLDEACFESFQVSDKVSDPDGMDCGANLGCAMLGLVKTDTPLGWGALFLFFFACFLHVVFSKYASRQAKKLMLQRYGTTGAIRKNEENQPLHENEQAPAVDDNSRL